MKEIKFKTVSVTNFKCYKEANFEFEPNRFVFISGHNGAGKTTLIGDALLWTVYDITTKGRRGDSVIRKRSGGDCSGIVVFSINDDLFKIENYKKHKKFGDSKILSVNNKDTKGKWKDISGSIRKETNQKIVDILMPQEVFLNCLLFSQFIGKPFTEMVHSGQKDIIDKMFNLTIHDDYQKLFGVSISELKNNNESLISNISIVENSISNNKEYLENIINDKTNYNQQQKEKLSDVKFLISNLKENLNNLEPKLSNVKEITEEQYNLSNNLSNVKNELYNLDKETREKKEKFNLENKYKKQNVIQDTTLKYQTKIDSITKTINSEKNKLSELNNDTNQTKAKYKDQYTDKSNSMRNIFDQQSKPLDVKLQNEKINEQSLSQSNDSLISECTKLKQDIKIIDENLSNRKCYTCGQKLQDDKYIEIESELNQKQEYLKKTEFNLNDTKNNLVTVKDNINQINISLEKISLEFSNQKENLEKWKVEMLDKLKDEYVFKSSDLISNINNNESELTSINEKLNSELFIIETNFKQEINNAYESIDNKHQEKSFQLKKDIALLNKKIENVNDLYEEKQKYILESNSIKTSINEKQNEFEKINNESSVQEKQFNSNIDKYKEIIKEKEKELKLLSKERKEFNEKLEILEFWKGAFGDTGIRSILLDEIIPILNKKSIELSNLTNSIRVTFDSQSQLKSGDLRNKFSVNVIETRNLTDDRTDFSGGEGRIVDLICLLSLRYALEKMHNVKFNITLLDEILDSLDPTNVDVILNMITKISKEQCVVLISHTLRDYIEADEILQLAGT